jgi:hypothetical protein
MGWKVIKYNMIIYIHILASEFIILTWGREEGEGDVLWWVAVWVGV